MPENYPPRPTATDEMIMSACKKVAANLDGADAATIAKYYQRGMDGWDLAKELDKYAYWDCSREDMEALDELDLMVDQAVRQAEKAWFAENEVKPPHPIGTRIKINIEPGLGHIVSICDYSPACYQVKPEGQDDETSGNRRIIVKFEDADLADEMEG